MTKTEKEKTAQTTDITPMRKQLLNLSPEDMQKLFNNPASGLENVKETRTMPYPYELGIVQKLTGDDMFANPDDNSRENWGKIFIKPRKTKNADGKYTYAKKLKGRDLHESMGFTLLRVEFGVEIWKNEKLEHLDFPIKKVMCRSKRLITSSERDAWLATHNPDENEDGLRYTNQVRLIMTPYSSKKVLDMASEGENPFISITLKGGDGWNIWGVINKEMTEAKRTLGIKGNISEVLSSLFRVTLSTVKTSQGGNDYWIYDGKVMLNEVEEALQFEELVNKLYSEFTFFNNTTDHDATLRDFSEVLSEEDEARVVQAQTNVKAIKEGKEEEVDEDDLPF